MYAFDNRCHACSPMSHNNLKQERTPSKRTNKRMNEKNAKANNKCEMLSLCLLLKNNIHIHIYMAIISHHFKQVNLFVICNQTSSIRTFKITYDSLLFLLMYFYAMRMWSVCVVFWSYIFYFYGFVRIIIHLFECILDECVQE